jgi:putative nucleotidyltransferase with HDIG domain
MPPLSSIITPDKPTVLIVDDEPAPRASLTHVLRQDFNILTADTAGAALVVLDQGGIDLVTLDLKLPDRPGSSLLRDIKLAHAAVEVIMVTAYGTLESAMDCIHQGAAGFLLKPFNASELLTISLQASHKKQRLDLLRAALTEERALREPVPSCTEAWHSLVARYSTLLRTRHPAQAAGEAEPSPSIYLVSDLLEAKARHLVNHANRVSFYATLVATRLELSLAEQQLLSLGALAHDLDLIHAPDASVLREQSDRKSHHPDVGAKIGRAIGLPADTLQIIALHHERWDGTGYPFGLQGEQIPFLARLVSLAQTFDELTADSPGKRPLSIKAALERIEQDSGSAFDPSLTAVFCRTMSEQPLRP